MSIEQPPTPQEKFYKKYVEKLNNFLKKINFFLKNLKAKILKQKLPENQQDQTSSDATAKEKAKIINHTKILASITIGFVFGAFMSSIILYFKIKKIEEDFQKTQTRLKVLSSRLQSYQNAQKNQTQNQNQDFQAEVLNTINNLPPSNAFASFYVNKLNEEKTKILQEERKKEQKVIVEKPVVKKTYKKPPPLPPLKTLIGKSSNTPPPPPPISIPPPLPKISMIICSSGCYAISSSGQVYTNGFMQGDYKLVVTQNQVYWEKVNQPKK